MNLDDMLDVVTLSTNPRASIVEVLHRRLDERAKQSPTGGIVEPRRVDRCMASPMSVNDKSAVVKAIDILPELACIASRFTSGSLLFVRASLQRFWGADVNRA